MLKLPNSFYEEEVRNGFTVTTFRKKCWARVLNLLYEFDIFAKKYDISYSLGYGTLLGAVRHHGFVPWDDDIDVNVARDDYMRLQKCAREYFSGRDDGIVYEDARSSDLVHFSYFVRLRDMNTTVAEPEMRKHGLFTGMFLDIFPVDSHAESEQELTIRKELWMTIMRDANIERLYNSGYRFMVGRDLVAKLWEMPLWEKMEVFDGFMLSSWQGSELVGNLYNDLMGRKSNWRRDAFSENIMAPFEGLVVPIPKGYDNVLRSVYGDYTTIRKGSTLHENTFMDPDTPCIEYREGRKKLPEGWTA